MKALYPDAQKEANKTPAFKGGEISARQGTMTVIFKARRVKDKWAWSASSSSAAGTADRRQEYRAKQAPHRLPGGYRRQYQAKYLARWSAELGTTVTSSWKLQRIKTGYPNRAASVEQLRVLEQPEFAELVAASWTGRLSDADIANGVCCIVGLRDLTLWPPTTPWEVKTHDGLCALLRIESGDESEVGTLFMTDVENTGQSYEHVWDAAVGKVGPDGTIQLVWSATAPQGWNGRAFSRQQVSAADTCAHDPGSRVSTCTVT